MLASAEVLQSVYLETDLDGKRFAQLFWNRTFQFPSRNLTIGPYGTRVVDVVFSRLNITSGGIEENWRYGATRKTIVATSTRAASWPWTGGAPPLDHPPCGYRGELCSATTRAFAAEVPAVVAAMALTALVCSICCYLK
ncbi:hypothetical protein RvY_04228-3 [Ramazzottius varieornatus]|nr:hypothetical protein RvY_04228-3 [Ramazzottius varieornatus]